jgi:hypothetical protein
MVASILVSFIEKMYCVDGLKERTRSGLMCCNNMLPYVASLRRSATAQRKWHAAPKIVGNRPADGPPR